MSSVRQAFIEMGIFPVLAGIAWAIAAGQAGDARAADNAMVGRIRAASLEEIARDGELSAFARAGGRAA